MAAAEPKIGSLCSGVGGLDLGVQSVLGGRIAWHAETDPHAAKVLARHWPGVPNLGDVRAADFGGAEPVDILTAGIPCQDLSVAGPRTGLAGTRSGLWRHIADAIPILNPRLVVIENVRGLLSTRAGTDSVRPLESCPTCLGDGAEDSRMRALGSLLADLADRGLDAAWCLLRASDIGAAHQRARVFLTAWPTAPAQEKAAEDTDGEPGHQRRLPAPGQAQGRGPRPHPGRRDRTPAAHPESERRQQGLAQPALPERQPHPGFHRGRTPCRGHIGWNRGHQAAAAHPDVSGRTRRRGDHPEKARRHESTYGHHSPADWWGEFGPAIRRWEHLTGCAAPSPTVPGTRRLSAEFVEWMMLPAGWVTGTPGLSRAAQLHLLGNSVVPQQAARALEILLPHGNPDRFPPSPARR